MALNNTQNLFTTLDGIESILNEPAGWAQIGAIIVAGIIAWLINLTQ